MKNHLLIPVLLLMSLSGSAQTTYSSATMLAKSCQVWGYLKYFHTNVNTCSIDWDSVLIAHVDAIKNAPDDAAFNQEIEAIIFAAGVMPLPVTPPDEPAPQFLHNLQFFWTDDPVFSDAIKNALDTVRARFRATGNCYVADNSSGGMPGEGWFAFTNENNNIPSPEFPSEAYRLLMMFRYWNIINYFFAYRDLQDVSWFTSLETYIPDMINAGDQLDYLLTLRYLSAAIDDAHASFVNADFGYLLSGGNSYPQFWMTRIDDQYVVQREWLPGDELQPGDIVLSLDGHTMDELIDSLGGLRPDCTEASWYRDLVLSMLRGPDGSFIEVEAAGPDGIFTISVERTTTNPAPDYLMSDPYPKYEIIDCGYGYVNMQKLLTAEIEAMYAALQDAPAIIFDCRNYPNGTAWGIINKLLEGRDTSAILNIPNALYPGTWKTFPYYEVSGNIVNANPYEGKIIVLCDEKTQSQAEYSIMKLQSFPDCKVIGTQTAGADGNISFAHLSDNTDLYFTTLEVLYDDSTQTQRIGVRIDSIVGPSVEGLRNGQDEALLAALDCLTGVPEVNPAAEWNIYPNPADNFIAIQNIPENTGIVVIKDITGKTVLETGDPRAVDVSHLPAGIYLVTFPAEHSLPGSRKLVISR